MKNWPSRIILIAALGAVGFWLWRALFPSPEHVIRKRLGELAQTASFSSNQAPLAKLGNSQKLAGFFTADVEVKVDVPGRSQQNLSGRDELLQAALGARAAPNGLSLEFVDINVVVAPDKKSATVNLTAKGRVQGERDLVV